MALGERPTLIGRPGLFVAGVTGVTRFSPVREGGVPPGGRVGGDARAGPAVRRRARARGGRRGVGGREGTRAGGRGRGWGQAWGVRPLGVIAMVPGQSGSGIGRPGLLVAVLTVITMLSSAR